MNVSSFWLRSHYISQELAEVRRADFSKVEKIRNFVIRKEFSFDLSLLLFLLASIVSFFTSIYFASLIYILSGYVAMRSGVGARIFFGTALFFLVLIVPMTEMHNFSKNHLAHSLLFLFFGAALQIVCKKLRG